MRGLSVGAAGLAVGLILLAGPGARAACQHPYYPVQVGLEWTYAELIAGPHHTVTEETVERIVSVEGARVVFDVTAGKAGSHQGLRVDRSEAYQVAAVCDADGVRKPLRVVEHKRQDEEDGVWLAPPSGLQPGKRWTHRFRSTTRKEGRSRRRGEDALEVRSGVEEVFTVQGFERVKVPAGEFDALKIVVERHHDVEIETTNYPPRGRGPAGEPRGAARRAFRRARVRRGAVVRQGCWPREGGQRALALGGRRRRDDEGAAAVLGGAAPVGPQPFAGAPGGS